MFGDIEFERVNYLEDLTATLSEEFPSINQLMNFTNIFLLENLRLLSYH
jgi:hypothetical protein